MFSVTGITMLTSQSVNADRAAVNSCSYTVYQAFTLKLRERLLRTAPNTSVTFSLIYP